MEFKKIVRAADYLKVLLLAVCLLSVSAASASQQLTSTTCQNCCIFNIYLLEDKLSVHVEYNCHGEINREKLEIIALADLVEEELLPGVKLFSRTNDGLVVIQVSGGQYVHMVNSTIKGFADGLAAPVFVEGNGFLHMQGGQIFQNKGAVSGGVAAFNGSFLVLEDSHFEGNSGGALIVKGDATLASISNVTFLRNSEHDLAVDLVVDEGAIVNSTSASFSGGSRDSIASALFFEQEQGNPLDWANMFITNSQGLWSSIHIGTGSQLMMSDSSIKWFVTSHGAISCGQNSVAVLVRTNFTDNFGMKGSGIHSEGGNVTVETCKFTGNFGEFGGAIASLAGGHLSLSNSILTDNVAAVGGAVYTGQSINDECSDKFDEGSVSIKGSVFERNLAQIDGGSIYSVCESLNLQDSKINESKAGSFGGGVVSKDNEETTIIGTNVTMCTSAKGGGLSLSDVRRISLSAMELFGNHAVEDGGAAHVLRYVDSLG